MYGAYSSFQPTGPRPRARTFSKFLRCIAVLTAIFSILAIVLIFISGITTREENNKIKINLSELSLVEFDGIIPTNSNSNNNNNNNTTGYDVKLYYFPAGFGWEYANATKKEQSGGLLYTGTDKLRVPGDFRRIAEKLELPKSAYECLDQTTQECTNRFFQQYKYKSKTEYSSSLLWFFCFYAVLAIFLALFKDILISLAPRHMGCHCPIGKSLCPAPKCEKDRLEYLAPSVWDSVRCYWYTFSAASVVACAIFLTIRANSMVGDLKDRSLTSAKMGSGFLVLMWGAAGNQVFAAVIMYVSRALNRSSERGQTFPSPNKRPEFAPVVQFQSQNGYAPQGGHYQGPQPPVSSQPQWKP